MVRKFYSPFVLSPIVREALKADRELFLLFAERHQGYDWEIDPLHRESYRVESAKKEEQLLQDLREQRDQDLAQMGLILNDEY